MNYSPIVCFGFDRPMHLNRMLESLEANKDAINLKSDTLWFAIKYNFIFFLEGTEKKLIF